MLLTSGLAAFSWPVAMAALASFADKMLDMLCQQTMCVRGKEIVKRWGVANFENNRVEARSVIAIARKKGEIEFR